MNGGGQQIDLDKLIEVRRKEKQAALKEKLQNELKTIRARKIPGVNHQPFPEGAFERLTSNSIWGKVLAYLTEPSDVTSAYFACGTFAEILEERRLLLMLPKVLNVYRINVDEDQNWLVRMNQSYIWKNVCLSFRQVCKAWKDITDFELFDSDFSQNDWFINADWIFVSEPGRSRIVCTLSNEGDGDLDQEMTFFTQLEAPTCIIRNVHLNLYDGNPDDGGISEEYLGKVTKFLKLHGWAVWSLYFCWECPTNIAILQERLFEMLDCVPNLKALVLKLFIREEMEEEDDIENLQLRINQQRRCPVLNSLEHFDACFDVEPDEHILCQILHECANLRSVSYVGALEYGDEIVTENITEALMKIPLECYEGYAIIIISNRVAWPLKKLSIAYQIDSVMASELFPAINRSQETLQYLEIWPTVEKDTHNVCLDLPHLKSLTLQRCTCGGTLSFNFADLLHLPSLEVMRFSSEMGENENSKMKIQYYLDTDEKEKSNVWDFFPNLQHLKYGGWCFYRPLTTS